MISCNGREFDSIQAADFSEDGLFRWRLTRTWTDFENEPIRWIVFCGMNPSIADDMSDDPTIRREVGFAKSLGANALVKVNLTPFIATDPRRLKSASSIWGCAKVRECNQMVLRESAKIGRGSYGRGVFAAWGALPKFLKFEEDIAISAMGAPLMCLGHTKDGSPRHPLYLPKATCPVEWSKKILT